MTTERKNLTQAHDYETRRVLLAADLSRMLRRMSDLGADGALRVELERIIEDAGTLVVEAFRIADDVMAERRKVETKRAPWATHLAEDITAIRGKIADSRTRYNERLGSEAGELEQLVDEADVLFKRALSVIGSAS